MDTTKVRHESPEKSALGTGILEWNRLQHNGKRPLAHPARDAIAFGPVTGKRGGSGVPTDDKKVRSEMDTSYERTPQPASRGDWLREMDLEPWLEVGDPLAEAVITALKAHRIPLSNPLPDIRRLAADGDDACATFLRDVETPAPWVDFDRMRLGGNMAYRHFPQLMVALLHGGLTTTFSSAGAAHILAGTNRLEQDVLRRLFESATLFFGVLEADALRPGGSAWEICVRVRLLHTVIRVHMTDGWPLRGKPVNAVQTAAGPLFFGAMVLDRMRLLGAYITAEESDGYYLIWRHVTRLLGVPPELVGDTAQEQAIIDARVLPYSFEPDQNSRRLTDVLLTGLEHLPDAEWVPRTAHEVLARYMLGPERADGMGIRFHPAGAWVMEAASRVLPVYGQMQRIPILARLLERAGRAYLNRTLRRGLAGVAADYQPVADHASP